jgi:hypothetical protein
MKMCDADKLRDDYQHRAENRDRARRRRAAFMNPRYHLHFRLDARRRILAPIERAA